MAMTRKKNDTRSYAYQVKCASMWSIGTHILEKSGCVLHIMLWESSLQTQLNFVMDVLGLN